MAKTKKKECKETHSYSQDYNLMTSFVYELATLRLHKDGENHLALAVVEEYLQNRVKEIKDRWK